MNKVVILCSFFCSLGFCYLFIKYSKSFGLLDVPNHRSSHSTPTPKGGGLSLYLSFNLALILSYEFGFIVTEVVQPLLFGSPIVAILGWLDDQKNLPAKLRLIIHLCVGFAIFFILTDGFRINIYVSHLPVNYKYIIMPFIILYISWFINLYNFMDGLDGLAGSTGLVASLFLAALFYLNNIFTFSYIYLLLAAGLVGFLIFNWSPAKIFLGDTGAYFLGFIFSTMSLITLIYEEVPLHVTIILFALFITDATYTLLVRLIRRENVFEAHRQFAFQKWNRKGLSHRKISLFYLSICIFWLCPLSYAAYVRPDYSMLFTVIAFIPLIYFCYSKRAGTEVLT